METAKFQEMVKSVGGKPGFLTKFSYEAIRNMISANENFLAAGECIDTTGTGAILITDKTLYASKKSGIFSANDVTIPLAKLSSFMLQKGFGSTNLVIAEGTLKYIFPQVSNAENILAAIKNGISNATQTVTPSQSSETIDKFDEIRKFKALLDDGIITQKDFDQKKAELLE